MLTNCSTSGEPSQLWLCAEHFIQQPASGKCITARATEVDDYYVDSLESLGAEGEVVLEYCSHGERVWQEWVGVDDNSNQTEPSICSLSLDEHQVSRCFEQDMTDPGLWVTCNRLGYFVSGLHHSQPDGNGRVTGLQCCAASGVFSGAPDSPDPAHEEGCQDVEWWRFEDALINEGWSRCPEGTFLKGLLLSPEPGTIGLQRAKCCWLGSTTPTDYIHQYTDSAINAGETGVHACLPGYHVAALLKITCTGLDCVEEITCAM